MKKIDIHSYVTAFPQYALPHKDGSRFMSAEEQMEFQKKLDIEKSVLVSIISPEGQRQKLGSENNKHIVTQNPESFEWFCGIDPRMGGFKDNAKYDPLFDPFVEMGACGVGEIAPSIYIDDHMTENLLAYCEKYNMPALVRYTYCYGNGAGTFDDEGLIRTVAFLKRHPKLKFIGSYEGIWGEFKSTLPECLRSCDNFCIDTAGKTAADALMQDVDYTVSFLNEFADRIYYGTGAYSANDTYPFELDKFLGELIQSGKLNVSAYEKIIRKNAEKLLG